jgi:sulfite exporter TauE/SafE
MILIVLILPDLSFFNFNKGVAFKYIEKLKSYLRKLFGIHTMRSLLLIGLLNGLLPCGLVYLGIAGALATGDILDGAMFMAAFGLGTIPAMLLVTSIRDYISIRFRERVRKVVPVFAGLMATMLILRGMGLGIPYISPAIENNHGVVQHECCHK